LSINLLIILQEARACDLVLWQGAIPLTVAKGIVHPGAGGRPDHVPVQVDLVMEGWTRVPLPVPTEEMTVLDDARGSIIQWPQTQIMLDQVAYLNNKYLSLHSNHSFGILENCTNFDTDTTR
jgi:hypothetical protein